MATKKTTPASGTQTRGAEKSTSARKPVAAGVKKTTARASTAKASTAKAEPVVLDPPKKPAPAKVTKPAETINVTPEVVKKAEDTKPKAAEAKPEPVKPAAEKPKPSEAKPETVIAAEPTKRAGFAGAFAGFVVGGVVAAGIGYFGAGYLNPTPDFSADLDRQTETLAATIGSLEARIAELETARADSPLTGVEEDIIALKAALETQSTAMSERLATTEAALAEALAGMEAARVRLAENLAETGGEISAATSELIARYGAEIDGLKEQVQTQIEASDGLKARLEEVSDAATEQLSAARDKVTELSQDAVEAARNIDMTLAAERLKVAVETGKEYASVLAIIAGEAAVEIPKSLMEGADDGVAPMLELQQSFPDAARRALKASVQTEAGDGLVGKLTAFLKSQLGPRSLEEKEGDDPDAILSRAEAALSRNDLRQAVELVRQLPEAGVAEMATWLGAADRRLEVQTALDELTEILENRAEEGAEK